jgi:short-subunit dehydrogenase
MYKEKYGPWALIVGGSEGIGRALAEKLAADGMHLILVARKRQALEQTAAAAKSEGPIEVRLLVQDMTSPDMMAGIESITADVEVGLLIYNAGAMDRVTTFLGDTLEGHLHTVRLNCEGPLRLCYHFAKQMAARRRGGIVLMSSASGLAGAYGVPVYGATKAFDLILAEGLWCELKEFGVSVLCAVLGLVHTPAHERLMGQVLPFGASAEDIAQEVLDHIDDGPTLFSRSVAALLPILRDPDRRAAVSQMAAASRKFFTGKINKAPYQGS